MNNHSKTALVKKDQINKEFSDQLTTALSCVPFDHENFHSHVGNKISGYYTVGCPFLLKKKDLIKNLWFVNEGAVVASVRDHKENRNVCLFFRKGEFVVLPNELMNGKVATTSLMACRNSHLLGILEDDVKGICKLFEGPQELYQDISSKQSDKYIAHQLLMRYIGVERVRQFYLLYPEFKGPVAKVKVSNRIISACLDFTENTFSVFLKQMREEDGHQNV